MALSKSIGFDHREIGQAASSPAVAERIADAGDFVDRLRSGEEAAFEILIDRYSAGIYALLFRLTENAEEASDLTQDTFLRALRSIRGFRGESELKTWLYRIAVNESRNRHRWWKRRRRNVTISLDDSIGDTNKTVSDGLADRSINPEEETLRREREYVLKAALLDIPEVFREAIVLRDIEGWTYEETAAALNVGLGTIKSRISRGRYELRRRLKDF
ncbi:MAG TPA: sigma-70 family RNA polymerase sigma factor [Pyrinomonadaceae bacterium]|nr:sigma-70 family RNA polymerase sigma factor [Pyrinomonadaceae bacterium]